MRSKDPVETVRVLVLLSLAVALLHQASCGDAAPVWTHTSLTLDSPLVARVAAAVREDAVAFAGGGQTKDFSTAGVYVVNTTSGTWITLVDPLPHPHAGSTTLGGHLPDLSLSFFSGDAPTGLPTTVELLDTKSMRWLPSLNTRLTHEFSACGGIASTIVCAGGQGHVKDDKEVPSATDVFLLGSDMSAEDHDTSYELSVARKKLSAASAGDVIGFALGFSDDASTKGYSDAYDLYNVATSTWSSGTVPSGEARQYGIAVGCGGKLIWAGGQVQGGRSGAVDILDARTGEWSNATLVYKRSNLAAACVGDRYAVFAGGQTPLTAAVECLDTATGEWSVLEDLSIPRGWLSGAGNGRCAVFAGGANKNVGGGDTVDIYCIEGGDGGSNALAGPHRGQESGGVASI